MIVDALRHRIERDVAERVIEKMADQIEEQHHAAGEANLPLADAAQKSPRSLEKG
jgi:hypothetical protein